MAVHLIACDKEANFYLTDQGTELLKRIGNDHFRTASFIGIERLGKSTVASVFAKGKFSSRAGNRGHTKGIWAVFKEGNMWLDFEGFAQDTRHNTRLLIAAVLLSNVVVYNTGPQITVDALDKLRAAGSLATQIGTAGDKPGLLYMLRDYSLDKKVPQSDYFESTMDQNKDLGDDIRSLFPQRSCVAIPPPGDAFLENPDLVGYGPHVRAALTVANTELESLRNSGKDMSGHGLIALANLTCSTLNTGDFDIGTAWQARLHAEKLVERMQREMRLTIFLSKIHGCGTRRWESELRAKVPEAELLEFKDLIAEARAENRRAWRELCAEEEDRAVARVLKIATLAELYNTIQTLSAQEEEILDAIAKKLLVAANARLRVLGTDLEQRLSVAENVAVEMRSKLDEVKLKKKAQHAAKEAELEARIAEKQRELESYIEQQNKVVQQETKQREQLDNACVLAAAEARADFEAQLKHSQRALEAEIEARRELEKSLTAQVKASLLSLKDCEQVANDLRLKVAEAEAKAEFAAAEKAQAEASMRECEQDKVASKRECERLRGQVQQHMARENDQLELGAQNQIHRAKIQRLEALLEEQRANNLELRKRPRFDDAHPVGPVVKHVKPSPEY